MPGAVERIVAEGTSIRAITSLHTSALQAVAEMAASYPYSHNVLGTQLASAYVLRLASHSQGKWYGLFSGECLRAAAHLALYGDGNGRDHSLWKVRHPLAHNRSTALDDWTTLFRGLVGEARAARPGSVKVVMFLSEHERDVVRASQCAGFVLEGRLTDYYRRDEECLVFGQTTRS